MERGVRAEPRSPALHAVLSRVRFAGTLPAAALKDLDRALALAPGCGWIRAWRGEAARQLGRLPEARRELEAAVRLSPRYGHAWSWLGGTLRRLGEPGAEAALRRGLASDPRHAWSWHELFLLLKDSAPARAAAALDRAHALNPRCDWISGSERGRAAYRRAAAEAQAAHARAPKPSLAFWAAHSLLEAGDAEAALTWARRAPRGPRTLALKARASAALGREPGERELTAALRLDPGFAHAWAWRGRVKLARGDASGAVRDLDRALALDPVCAWGHLLRARGRAALGRRGPAREDAARALAIHAGYGEARDFLKSLGRDS
jgi:tetratricopeptide (TPR) repeat protein